MVNPIDRPLPLPDKLKIPEGMFEEALSGPGDPRKNRALLELIQCVLPYAMNLIRGALEEGNSRRTKAPTTSQMRELVQAQHVPQPDDDPGEEDPDVRAEIESRARDAIDRATEAALFSAAESFHGHGIREFSGVRSLHELALHLIRITYNRYQKRRREAARLGRQAASGRGAQGEGSFLESRPDEQEDPAAETELEDFLEIQRGLTDGVLEGFSVRDRRIVLLYEAGFEPEHIVTLMNRLNKGRRPCTLNTVNHVIETFKAQISRLEVQVEDERSGNQKGSHDESSIEPWRHDGSDPRSPQVPPS